MLSLDELQVISQLVPHDCTCLKKELQIDDPETNCYKVLENWSKRKESSRDGLKSALFGTAIQVQQNSYSLSNLSEPVYDFRSLLTDTCSHRNDAFRMFK